MNKLNSKSSGKQIGPFNTFHFIEKFKHNRNFSTQLFKRGLLSVCILATASFFPIQNQAQDLADSYAQLRKLEEQKKWSDMRDLALELQKKSKNEGDLQTALFGLGKACRNLNLQSEALEAFRQISQKEGLLKENALFEAAQLEIQQGNPKQAKKDLQSLVDLSPNLKLVLESRIHLAKLELESQNFKAALQHLVRLEKQQRRQEKHGEILFLLAQAQRALHSTPAFCRSIRTLYSRYPSFEKIADWNLNLAQSRFQGQPTGCVPSMDDQKNRIRALQWAGLSEKAEKELASLPPIGASFDTDRLRLHFLIQEGDSLQAIEILRKHRKLHEADPQFQSTFAVVAARIGEYQAAIGAYHRVFTSAPKSKIAKQALFQSAFLSYQSRDYDGATRRFQEFARVYKNSGLARDARWHLAWMKYLRGDFQGAINSLQLLGSGNSKRNNQMERIRYWLAMSHYRLGKFEKARSIFESLSKNSNPSFYSLAARARLKKIDQEKKELRLAAKQQPALQPFSGIPVVRPWSDDDSLAAASELASAAITPTETVDEESESEESLSAANSEDENTSESEAAEEGLASSEQKNLETQTPAADEETSEARTSFANPVLVRRFEKARELMLLGEQDWAKWDLYEIERKTTNPTYLRTLMLEYEKVGNFNRSSSIATLAFAHQRAQYGIDGIRFLWESAYPKAYQNSVLEGSKKWGVSQELIWGIMRAESVYKRDAISPVGALGLMQIMPMTALRVADMLGVKSFQANQLLQPPVAVNMGAFYLQRLGKKFQFTDSLIAAAYNAGPHRVKTWLSSFGFLDQDEFIEHIPFVETRNYVKKVLSNVWVYGKLYGNKTDTWAELSEPLRVRFSDPPPTRETWEEI